MFELKASFLVNEKGEKVAAQIGIKEYQKLKEHLKRYEFLDLLKEEEREMVLDYLENLVLSKSPEFKKLVEAGLNDIKKGEVEPWKEVWSEL
ncbi:MAG: hypothetical protein ACE5KE_09195 [Methanosarcinales archaeon]